MKSIVLKNTWIFAIISALVLAAATIAVSAEQRHSPADHEGHDALVEEMRKLDAAFREIVSGVALGDGHRVHSAIEPLHGTMEKTRDALHRGDVKLRKNAGDVKVFEKMDRDFHQDLESLAQAAHKNDGKRMNELAKKLLDGCVSCHNSFRP